MSYLQILEPVVCRFWTASGVELDGLMCRYWHVLCADVCMSYVLMLGCLMCRVWSVLFADSEVSYVQSGHVLCGGFGMSYMQIVAVFCADVIMAHVQVLEGGTINTYTHLRVPRDFVHIDTLS